MDEIKIEEQALTVFCPKDNEEVPIWYCLGSMTQRREMCSYLQKAVIHKMKTANVKCTWKKSDDG